MIQFMQETLIRTLRARRAQIRARWESFLRIERVDTPLGHPDTLVFMFDQTLDQVFEALRAPAIPPAPVPRSYARSSSPLLAYFLAGEQALLEVLVMIQSDLPGLDPGERDSAVTELRNTVRTIATREIELLSGVYVPAPAPSGRRHGTRSVRS